MMFSIPRLPARTAIHAVAAALRLSMLGLCTVAHAAPETMAVEVRGPTIVHRLDHVGVDDAATV